MCCGSNKVEKRRYIYCVSINTTIWTSSDFSTALFHKYSLSGRKHDFIRRMGGFHSNPMTPTVESSQCFHCLQGFVKEWILFFSFTPAFQLTLEFTRGIRMRASSLSSLITLYFHDLCKPRPSSTRRHRLLKSSHFLCDGGFVLNFLKKNKIKQNKIPHDGC